MKAIPSPLKILVLQHPQEKKKPMNSAGIVAEALRGSEVKVGLSWPSFKKAVPQGKDPNRWAVLYAGTRTAFKDLKMLPKETHRIVNKYKSPARLKDLEGVIILDGTWQQSKTLWWRNPWLLKLNRLILNPASLSLRTQVRDYYMSTAEAVAQVMNLLQRDDIQAHLLTSYKEHLDALRHAPAKAPDPEPPAV